MTGVVDCVERMFQFKQRCPEAEFDLKPYLFTARVPAVMNRSARWWPGSLASSGSA